MNRKMSINILKKNEQFFKKLWKQIILLIFLASAVECHDESGNKKICSSSGCQEAANLLKNNMDQQGKPCNDFYEFACGSFLERAVIPDNEYIIDHVNNLQNKIYKQIKELLETKVNPNEPRIFRLAKDYYRSCMDESTRDQNLKALLDIIKQLGGWPLLEGRKWQQQKFDVFESDRKLRKIGYQPNRIFHVYACPNLQNISQSILCIGPPDPLVKIETLSGASMNNVNLAYHKYMIAVAILLGANKTTAELYLRRVIDFEKDLVTGTSNFIERKFTSIEKLYEMADNYPWKKYINDMIEPIAHFDNSATVFIVDITYFQKAIYVLNKYPKITIANYVIWKVIAESIKYLPKEFRELSFEFDKVRSEKEAPPLKLSRWNECIGLITDKESGLTVAVSSMYIRKYFKDESRKDVEPILSSVAIAFKEVLSENKWMNNGMKKAALKKIEYISNIIAYPDELLNNRKIDEYSNSLNISSDDHFKNFLNLQRFHYEFHLTDLNRSIKANLWEFFSDSTSVNAYYYPLANTFVLLAAIMQQPLFNSKWPSYATFGSMGFIIAHEMMHAYDARRIWHDFADKMNNVDQSIFLNRLHCFVDQYSGYVDNQTSTKLNGGLMMDENVADTGGLKIAYRAYRKWVEQHGEDPRPMNLRKFSADQLFFLSTINLLCGKTTKEKRNDDLKNDPHTPNDFRTLGMISNSKEFAQAYKCPLGSRMNPEKKCAMWE